MGVPNLNQMPIRYLAWGREERLGKNKNVATMYPNYTVLHASHIQKYTTKTRFCLQLQMCVIKIVILCQCNMAAFLQ